MLQKTEGQRMDVKTLRNNSEIHLPRSRVWDVDVENTVTSLTSINETLIVILTERMFSCSCSLASTPAGGLVFIYSVLLIPPQSWDTGVFTATSELVALQHFVRDRKSLRKAVTSFCLLTASTRLYQSSVWKQVSDVYFSYSVCMYFFLRKCLHLLVVLCWLLEIK